MGRKITLQERFWSKVDRSAGANACWPWLASVTTTGYGKLIVDGKCRTASRVAYQLAYGDPGNLFVLHRCDNPKCVNPAHLFLGTNAENMADMKAKGRQRNRPEWMRGPAAPNVKLTPEQRDWAVNSTLSCRKAAQHLGVGPSTVHRARIWHRKIEAQGLRTKMTEAR